MTLQQLKYVVEVAERGSITEAAKSLFIAQPSLSAAIRDLEEETGTTIFLRNSRGILLTQEGVEFLGYARQVVQQAPAFFRIDPALFLYVQRVRRACARTGRKIL